MTATCPKGHPLHLVTVIVQSETFTLDENGDPEPVEVVRTDGYEGDDMPPYVECPTCMLRWSVEQFPRDGERVFGCPYCGCQKVEADTPRATQIRYYNDAGDVVDVDTDHGDAVGNERCAECERPFDETAWRS